MSFRTIFKFMVLVLSILLANLIAIWIDKYLLTFRYTQKPYIFTWIGMLVVVAIYYPLFAHIDKWSTKFSERVIRSGSKFAGRKAGSILAFLAILLIIYMLYGYEWYNTNILFVFFKWLGGEISALFRALAAKF